MKPAKIISIIFLMPLATYAQSGIEYTDEELFEEGEFFYLAEDYEESVYYFKQLHQRHPDNEHFAFKTGMTLLQIPGRESEAIPYLEQAITNTTTRYKERSFNEKQAPHHACFYLGNAYRINNELEKALLTYEEFRNSEEFEGNYNVRIVEDEIHTCTRAKIIQDVPVELEIEDPGSPINTPRGNHHPVLSYDGEVLVYISEQTFYDAIFLSRKVAGRWSEPINLNPLIGSDGDLYPTGTNEDGTEIFLVSERNENNDLYYTRFDGTNWSKAKPLAEPVNSRYNENHASLSRDGKRLYFSSDRPGGEGGSDLYISARMGINTWSDPVNLGSTINSPGNEDAPYPNHDESRIYFSSNRHFNMGGYDIFYVYKNNKGRWSDPVNIGYPLNTTGDNRSYQPIGKGYSGVMSQIREGGKGEEDIYLVRILKESNRWLEKPEEPVQEFYLNILDTWTGDTLHFEIQLDESGIRLIQLQDRYKIVDK